MNVNINVDEPSFSTFQEDSESQRLFETVDATDLLMQFIEFETKV